MHDRPLSLSIAHIPDLSVHAPLQPSVFKNGFISGDNKPTSHNVKLYNNFY